MQRPSRVGEVLRSIDACIQAEESETYLGCVASTGFCFRMVLNFFLVFFYVFPIIYLTLGRCVFVSSIIEKAHLCCIRVESTKEYSSSWPISLNRWEFFLCTWFSLLWSLNNYDQNHTSFCFIRIRPNFLKKLKFAVGVTRTSGLLCIFDRRVEGFFDTLKTKLHVSITGI